MNGVWAVVAGAVSGLLATVINSLFYSRNEKKTRDHELARDENRRKQELARDENRRDQELARDEKRREHERETRLEELRRAAYRHVLQAVEMVMDSGMRYMKLISLSSRDPNAESLSVREMVEWSSKATDALYQALTEATLVGSDEAIERMNELGSACINYLERCTREGVKSRTRQLSEKDRENLQRQLVVQIVGNRTLFTKQVAAEIGVDRVPKVFDVRTSSLDTSR